MLGEKSRDRANYARRTAKRPRYDSAGVYRRLERAPPHFGAQWRKKLIPGLHDAASKHHHFGIENIKEIGDRRSNEARRLLHHLIRECVTCFRRLIHHLRRDIRGIAAGERKETRRLTAGKGFARPFGRRGARCIRFKASIVAAFAASPRGIDRRMADLACDVAGAMIELAIQNEPAADTCADRHANDVTRTFRSTNPPLAECGAVRIIVERRWQANNLRHAIA